MIKKGLLAIGLLASLNTLAQDVNPYAPGNMEEGVVYYLPKTQIEVKVTVTQITYTPGKLCQYANQYLKLQNISLIYLPNILNNSTRKSYNKNY